MNTDAFVKDILEWLKVVVRACPDNYTRIGAQGFLDRHKRDQRKAKATVTTRDRASERGQ